jgi:hypothetical protein
VAIEIYVVVYLKMAEVESPSSSAAAMEALAEQENPEPAAKKAKIESAKNAASSEKLEHRLGGILCCAVCLDLPRSAVYQVIIEKQLARGSGPSAAPLKIIILLLKLQASEFLIDRTVGHKLHCHAVS